MRVKIKTLVKMRDLGITKNFMRVTIVNELPETGEKGLCYVWNFHVWYYGKAPDEPIKRWHDLGSVSDFDDEERESDTE